MAAIKGLVTSQAYEFVPETAMPATGPTRQLTGYFVLRIDTGRLVCDLPYFGRAYVAPIDPTKGPLTFTSHQFKYTITPGKKEGWQVVIHPQGLTYSDVQRMMLDISPEGYASLRVSFINHDPMTFSGRITAREAR